MRDRRHLVLIPLAALLAIAPLLYRGYSCGHDFGFHLMNWLEVGSQWKQGILSPHWEFTAAWNSGEPRFVFYPPLSWTIGALLGLVLPWAAVPNTFIWLALAACGFTMYRLAREWTDKNAALIAACFFMVHPYMLFTFYERSAYAELLAAAWIPLLLLSLLRPRITISRIAVPVALLWLTNDPAAVMGCYLLALLALLRIIWTYRGERSIREALRQALQIAGGTCLGFALAGLYLVPAIAERKWVQIRLAAVPGVRIQDNFLFGQFGGPAHKAILLTASLCSVTVLLLAIIFGVIALLRNPEYPVSMKPLPPRFVISAFLLSALVAGFMLTAPSGLLWRHLPNLTYLQFPWRLDAVLGAIAAALLALAVRGIRMSIAAAAAIAFAITLSLSFTGNHFFRQRCSRDYGIASLVESFYRGSVFHSDDYTPAGSDPLAVKPNHPDAWIAASPAGEPAQNMAEDRSATLSKRLHFDVTSPQPEFLIVNIRDYPAWRVAVNGKRLANHPHRPDGLIVVPLAAGSSTISIRYALTADQIAGWALTAAALLLLFAIWWTERRSISPSAATLHFE